MRGRRAGWLGIAFMVLLLLQAGMADIPTTATPIGRIQRFYANHGGIILVAQIISVLASILFLVFVWSMAGQLNPRTPAAVMRLRATGVLVGLASIATAIPPVLLAQAAAPSDATAHALTRAADLTDVVLFAAIALFSLELARDATIGWLKGLALAVVALSAVRAVLGIAEVTALDIVAPLAFLALVVAVSIGVLRGWLTPAPP